MSYTIQKFEKEQVAIGSEMRDIFVALIKKDTEDQPFRVTIENFATKEDAMKEVNAWIAQQEFEDAHAVQEKVKAEEQAQKDATMNDLNADLGVN